MTKQPILGDGVAIDVDRLLVTRLLVQANSGGGKSYALRRLLEQTFGCCQHIVLDPEGEFHTLRENFDYALAGKGGEAAVTVATAELLAVRLLELGVSAIVDISELGSERPAFVTRFLEALMGAPRELWHPALVVVDEAHRYCPQGARPRPPSERDEDDPLGVEDSAAAVISLMDSGRKRGFCGVLATQRLSKLSKDATAECNNKLIGRCVEIDARRAADELGLASRDAVQQLRKLRAGEFYAFGPALSDDVQLVRVGPVQTTHPEAGKAAPLATPTPEHVRKVLGKLKSLPTEAADEARTVEQLRARIRELELKVGATPVAPERLVERVEVPVISKQQMDMLVAALGDAGTMTHDLLRAIDVLGMALKDIESTIQLEGDVEFTVLGLEDSGKEGSSHGAAGAVPSAAKSSSPQTGRSEKSRGAKARAADLAGSERRSRGVTAGETAPKGKVTVIAGKHQLRVPADSEAAATLPRSSVDGQDVVDAIGQLRAIGIDVTIKSLAAWLNVHPKTKSLLTVIGALRADGVLDGLQLTEAGAAAVRELFVTPNADARVKLTRPLTESQVRILDMLATFEAKNRLATHVALAAWLGVHPKTKSLLDDLGRLRERGYLTDLELTDLGRHAAEASYTDTTQDDIIAPLDDNQRRIASAVLRQGVYASIGELAADLDMHPKTKTLLEGVGALRKRGLFTNGWPLRPSDVFGGAA